jgi:hypothetical protein
VWVKQDCWLEPKPGSVEAAAYAAAVARYKQQLKQAQQQMQSAGTSVSVAAAAVATALPAASTAAATAAVVVTASTNNSGVIDLTGDDGDQAAATGTAAAAAAVVAMSPSKEEVIDLSGQTTVASPTTAVSGQLSGLQLLLQQHRSQQQQQQQQQQGPLAALQPPPRVVHIMRGLPGSGKSTRAAQIAAEARAAAAASNSSSSSSSVEPVAIHSTDSYFIDPTTGVYTFDFERLSTNHECNFNAFCASLQSGVGTIIVDNTNLQVGHTGTESLALLSGLTCCVAIGPALLCDCAAFKLSRSTALHESMHACAFDILGDTLHRHNLQSQPVRVPLLPPALLTDVYCCVLCHCLVLFLLQPWQYEKYVQQAWAAGYRVREEVVGEFTQAALALYAQRNVHGVPFDKLQIMLDQWHNQ